MFQGAGDRDDLASFGEGHILEGERDGANRLLACVGVFPGPEEVVEGDCAKVGNCLLSGCVKVCSFLDNIVDYA